MQESSEANVPSMEMPKYDCFKQVWALKIKEVQSDYSTAGIILFFENTAYAGRKMSAEWAARFKPVAGGYLVVYTDGYQSFSPDAAFEAGYRLHRKPGNKEADRMVSVDDAGHKYTLHTVEGKTAPLVFIKKAPKVEGSNELVVVHDGVTTEGVLDAVLHRLQNLNGKVPDSFNKEAILHIEAAIGALEARTADRKERGVEGSNAK